MTMGAPAGNIAIFGDPGSPKVTSAAARDMAIIAENNERTM